MSDKNFTATITVDKTPEEAFAAINDVWSWWSETVEGTTGTVGDSYRFEVPGIHRCTMTTTESVPGKRLVWHVTDSHLAFIADTAEWEDTDVVFDLTETATGTEIRFTHVGLAPEDECYEVCSNAWSAYITTSLHDLLTTGTGDPFRRTSTGESELIKHGNAALVNLDALR
ncbi:SRPBCC family protein [Nocardia caishijiensis]|uniref:Activator of Hsp90 ATPase-like protein n=1 Tax=Nocardia caishijiensis TaxID=184756 RepID=A0ABQ6YTJ4_9NOCA|nr:SRPBCC domain-containing protein [Nocardia caishijiensis]KAF0849119.1 activator of Hsp90 ATPase-like protein [Nocardia caishijiensis]